jgi:hypothetical protein
MTHPPLDEITVDENLRNLKTTPDRAQCCFGAVPVQYQFFELEARVAQQALGA